MGINDFNNQMQYIILFLVLLFLENKVRNEQFVLSSITDFIINTATTLKLNNMPNWNIYSHRKYLHDVIKHLSELSIIKVIDEQNSFAETIEAEALYESTGLSNYYVKEFNNNIQDYSTLDEYVNDEFAYQDNSLGDVRRFKVFRHLLYSLCSYSEDLNEFETDYLKRFRGSINQEFSKYTRAELEITKNCTMLMFEPEAREKLDFPNTKALTDIVLMFNKSVVDKVDNKLLQLEPDETIIITKESLERIIKDVKEENLPYISKKHKDMTSELFLKEVTSYLKEYDFIRPFEDKYKIYPSVARLTGYIPKGQEKNIDLFGGTYE